MGHYFFDSSGLVKRYIAEVGSAWVQSLCAPDAKLHLHHIRRELDLPPLIFVSADESLNAVAEAEGLHAENPNVHP